MRKLPRKVEVIEEIERFLGERVDLATGGSCIVNPSGLFVREPVFGEETIVWAEIDQAERRLAKAYFDSVGHYARWDLLQLVLREEGWEPLRPPEPSPARLREAAERHEVRLARLERLVEEIVRGPGPEGSRLRSGSGARARRRTSDRASPCSRRASG